MYVCDIDRQAEYDRDKAIGLYDEDDDRTADELAADRYVENQITYADYVAVCELEECEPVPQRILDLKRRR